MHVMIDTETLGIEPGSVILTIGAVAFDPLMFACPIGETFYKTIDPISAQACGLLISASTVKWWSEQSADARTEAFSGSRSLIGALSDFACFLSDVRRSAEVRQVYDGHLRVWSHGLGADIVWLEAAYRVCGLQVPWSYREPRDTRTLLDLAGLSLSDFAEGVEHHALDDARRQAKAVVAAYRKLGLAPAGIS